MRVVLLIVGGLTLSMGIIWALQGAGLFPYPRESFMIAQTPWIWRGLLLAGIGAALIAWARGMRGAGRPS